MKATLLEICIVYFLFGATLYAGTLWCLRIFLYPSWVGLGPDNVQVHFIGPTTRATKFFTVVVPLMMAAGIALIVGSWHSDLVWANIVAVLGIIASTILGEFFIIPINKRIAKGVTASELTPLLKRWMFLNDLRWITTTIMWAAALWYALGVGDVHAALR